MRLLAAICVLVFVAAAGAAPRWHNVHGYTFQMYKEDFAKVYDAPAEHDMRKSLFEQRVAEIKMHNANPKNTYRKGVNHMTDWTDSERQRLNGAIPHRDVLTNSKPLRTHVRGYGALPHSIDYRKASPPILTAVKDQGHCGSCWAHGAVEAIESHYAIRTGNLYVLSQQQLVSCTKNPDHCGGTGGCFGNIPELAYDYVVEAHGIAQEWAYPYDSYLGTVAECNATLSSRPVVKLSGYVSVARNDADALMDALVNVGPLAVSVDASHWFEYHGGVYTGCSYAKNISQDHEVQLVGYGHDYSLGLDYWLIRNSWSPGWGENGFIRLIRETPTACGWNVKNQDGVGCKNDPPVVWACGTCGIAYDAVYPIPDVN